MDSLPFSLATAVAAAVLFLPITVSGLGDSVHRPDSLMMEASAFVAGFVGASLTWRAARRWGFMTPRAGIVVGVVTALVVHLLLSISMVLPAGFDLEMLMVAGLVFAWSLVLFGWLSFPLGALVGWWMMRRALTAPPSPPESGC
jgi:hypothetical protein